MIAPADRIAVAPGVRLTRAGLDDPVRGTTFALNESARAVASAHTVADAAAALVRTFGAPADVALADATRFCTQLNERLLLEVAPRGGLLVVVLRWLAFVCRLAPLRIRPRVPSRRRHVETSSLRRLLRTGTWALAGPGFALGVLAGLAALVVVHALALALAVTLAVTAGVVTHELGHLALLRGVPACIVVRGLRVSVLHRSLRPTGEACVAAGGPFAGVALTAVALLALELWPGPELATVALLQAGQLLGLTTLTRDGRRMCAAW
jgi:coenzyme PQQ synthesis protein D (PqqD)